MFQKKEPELLKTQQPEYLHETWLTTFAAIYVRHSNWKMYTQTVSGGKTQGGLEGEKNPTMLLLV